MGRQKRRGLRVGRSVYVENATLARLDEWMLQNQSYRGISRSEAIDMLMSAWKAYPETCQIVVEIERGKERNYECANETTNTDSD